MLQLRFSTIACFILLQSLSSISSSFAGGPGDQKPVHEQPKIVGSEDEGPIDERPGVIRELQRAIRVDDKRWMADHLHLPVRYNGKKTLFIKSQAWFLKHYDSVITPQLKASILAQDPEKYSLTYQGLRVGESGCCNVWLEDFGDLGGGRGIDYEITAINPG